QPCDSVTSYPTFTGRIGGVHAPVNHVIPKPLTPLTRLRHAHVDDGRSPTDRTSGPMATTPWPRPHKASGPPQRSLHTATAQTHYGGCSTERSDPIGPPIQSTPHPP